MAAARKIAAICSGASPAAGRDDPRAVLGIRLAETPVPEPSRAQGIETAPAPPPPHRATPEERQAAQLTQRARRQRQIDQARASVDALLADQTPGTTLPVWAQAHAREARKGSRVSLIALKCGDCVGWCQPEIKNCTLVSCPLWSVRPYQPALEASGDREAEKPAEG
jgi:hypothetical protein